MIKKTVSSPATAHIARALCHSKIGAAPVYVYYIKFNNYSQFNKSNCMFASMMWVLVHDCRHIDVGRHWSAQPARRAWWFTWTIVNWRSAGLSLGQIPLLYDACCHWSSLMPWSLSPPLSALSDVIVDKTFELARLYSLANVSRFNSQILVTASGRSCLKISSNVCTITCAGASYVHYMISFQMCRHSCDKFMI